MGSKEIKGKIVVVKMRSKTLPMLSVIAKGAWFPTGNGGGAGMEDEDVSTGASLWVQFQPGVLPQLSMKAKMAR